MTRAAMDVTLQPTPVLTGCPGDMDFVSDGRCKAAVEGWRALYEDGPITFLSYLEMKMRGRCTRCSDED